MFSVSNDARQFVAAIQPDIFHQKYDHIVASQDFGALIRCECTRNQLDKVSHALHDAGIPDDFLQDDAQVIDTAGHLMQMSLYLIASHKT